MVVGTEGKHLVEKYMTETVSTGFDLIFFFFRFLFLFFFSFFNLCIFVIVFTLNCITKIYNSNGVNFTISQFTIRRGKKIY